MVPGRWYESWYSARPPHQPRARYQPAKSLEESTISPVGISHAWWPYSNTASLTRHACYVIMTVGALPNLHRRQFAGAISFPRSNRGESRHENHAPRRDGWRYRAIGGKCDGVAGPRGLGAR